jgi:hypothetical protein
MIWRFRCLLLSIDIKFYLNECPVKAGWFMMWEKIGVLVPTNLLEGKCEGGDVGTEGEEWAYK